MPPVNPQGSRGGLVAAVVVFTVLFVVATIFAIYYGVQDNKAEDSIVQMQARYHDIVQDLTSTDVSDLRTAARSDQQLPEQTALAEAIKQRNALRTMILGETPPATDQPVDQSTQSDISEAIAKAQKAMADAGSVLGAGGAKFSADNLVQAISNLTRAVASLNQAAKAAIADRDAVRAQAAKDQQAARDAQAAADKAVSQAKETMQEQLDAAGDAVKKADDDVAAAKKVFDDEAHASGAALDASDKKIIELTAEVESAKKMVSGLSDKLAGRRLDVIDPIIRRPEGQILALGDANTVYISLGQGDHISPGMTFEVYDAAAPLPKLGDGMSEDNMPVGKASIEVTKVLPNGSECHITRVTGGEQIVAGDPVLNLIYDRNVKTRFFVYGDFDISRSGHPTPAGADLVRRLIVEWGGQLDKTINPETDIVVMGEPPEIPPYTADDLKDPLKAQDLANAQRAANEYENTLEQAEKLNIPILNQNKFLFFTGYYDVALR
jgi:hypothetical protein